MTPLHAQALRVTQQWQGTAAQFIAAMPDSDLVSQFAVRSLIGPGFGDTAQNGVLPVMMMLS
jgi:hypothetical protein